MTKSVESEFSQNVRWYILQIGDWQAACFAIQSRPEINPKRAIVNPVNEQDSDLSCMPLEKSSGLYRGNNRPHYVSPQLDSNSGASCVPCRAIRPALYHARRVVGQEPMIGVFVDDQLDRRPPLRFEHLDAMRGLLASSFSPTKTTSGL
jgi:hypothetical protein